MKKQTGMAFVEICIAVLVIAYIAAMAIPALMDYQCRAATPNWKEEGKCK